MDASSRKFYHGCICGQGRTDYILEVIRIQTIFSLADVCSLLITTMVNTFDVFIFQPFLNYFS